MYSQPPPHVQRYKSKARASSRCADDHTYRPSSAHFPRLLFLSSGSHVYTERCIVSLECSFHSISLWIHFGLHSTPGLPERAMTPSGLRTNLARLLAMPLNSTMVPLFFLWTTRASPMTCPDTLTLHDPCIAALCDPSWRASV